MRIYDSSNIRNIGILGHSGSGKSNMVEGLEFTAGLASRITGNENDTKITSSLSLHAIEYQGTKYNFVDIPGYSDFFGEVESGLAAVDGAIIIVDGTTDLTVGTETALELTDSRNIPRFIFVNKIDNEKADYEKILSQLREKYGKRIAPFHVAWGKGDGFRGHINVVDMFAREFDKGKNECKTVDMPDDMVQYFDYILAGYHYGSRPTSFRSILHHIDNLLFSGKLFSKKYNTRALVKAMHKYDIKYITHPGDKGVIDIVEVAQAAVKTNTGLEINGHHDRLSASMIKAISHMDIDFYIGSDAHKPENVANFEMAYKIVEESGLDPGRIVNLG